MTNNSKISIRFFWLKRKLTKEQNQLVSATHGFKFVVPDGKLPSHIDNY